MTLPRFPIIQAVRDVDVDPGRVNAAFYLERALLVARRRTAGVPEGGCVVVR
jgi:hypothetical protein